MAVAMTMSVSSGRCGPWASIAPTGSTTSVCSRSKSRTSSHVSCASSCTGIRILQRALLAREHRLGNMTNNLPEHLNIADWLLDARVREGRGDRPALLTDQGTFTYRDVQVLANRFV